MNNENEHNLKDWHNDWMSQIKLSDGKKKVIKPIDDKAVFTQVERAEWPTEEEFNSLKDEIIIEECEPLADGIAECGMRCEVDGGESKVFDTTKLQEEELLEDLPFQPKEGDLIKNTTQFKLCFDLTLNKCEHCDSKEILGSFNILPFPSEVIKLTKKQAKACYDDSILNKAIRLGRIAKCEDGDSGLVRKSAEERFQKQVEQGAEGIVDMKDLLPSFVGRLHTHDLYDAFVDKLAVQHRNEYQEAMEAMEDPIYYIAERVGYGKIARMINEMAYWSKWLEEKKVAKEEKSEIVEKIVEATDAKENSDNQKKASMQKAAIGISSFKDMIPEGVQVRMFTNNGTNFIEVLSPRNSGKTVLAETILKTKKKTAVICHDRDTALSMLRKTNYKHLVYNAYDLWFSNFDKPMRYEVVETLIIDEYLTIEMNTGESIYDLIDKKFPGRYRQNLKTVYLISSVIGS
jgi:hypothetical protein